MTALKNRAATASVQTHALTPAMAAALGAVAAAKAEAERLDKAHSAAREACDAIEATSIDLHYPDILTVQHPETILIVNGERRPVPRTSYTYKEPDVIRESTSLSDDQKAAMLAALAEREQAQAKRNEECGLTAASAAEDETYDAYLAADHRLDETIEAALRVPTVSPADLDAKGALLAGLASPYIYTTHFVEAMLAGTLEATGAPPLPVLDTGVATDWATVSADLEAADAEMRAAAERFDDLSEAVNVGIEKPSPNAYRFYKGEPSHVLTVAQVAEVETALKDLNPAIVAQVRAEAVAYWDALKAAEDRLGLTAANQAVEDLEQRADDLRRDWFLTAAPDVSSVIRKHKEAVKVVLGFDLEDPDDVAEMLSGGSFDRIAAVGIYRDLCRLARLPTATAEVEAFDVQDWVHRFEALPGHVLHRGQVAYLMPAAWTTDPDLQDEAFTLSDPVEIRKYHDATAARGGDYAAYIERCRAERPDYDTRPVPFLDDLPDTLFPDDPARLAEWRSRMKRRREACKGEPVGQRLWNDLPRWAKNLVQEFGRSRGEADEDDIRALGYAAVEKRRHEAAKAAVAHAQRAVA